MGCLEAEFCIRLHIFSNKCRIVIDISYYSIIFMSRKSRLVIYLFTVLSENTFVFKSDRSQYVLIGDLFYEVSSVTFGNFLFLMSYVGERP